MILLVLLMGILSVCPEDQVEIDGKCYPESCVFDGLVCAGHGSCELNYCLCDEGYRISDIGCTPIECTDEMGQVCGNHGTCERTLKGFKCKCDEGYTYVSSTCAAVECVNDGKICGGYGDCTVKDGKPVCDCNSFTAGEFCEDCEVDAVRFGDHCVAEVCLTKAHDGTTVECGGFGACFRYPVVNITSCICYPSTVLTNRQCIPFECAYTTPDGILFCANNGMCTPDRTCLCDSDFDGELCQYKKVECPPPSRYLDGQCVTDGCVSPDEHVCGGHGDCQDDTCICHDGYVLSDDHSCVPIECMIDGQMCPYGTCKSRNGHWQCECRAEYQLYNGRCYPSSCIADVQNNGDPVICSNSGVCDMDARRCICNVTHTGTYCQKCSEQAINIEGTCVIQSCVNYDYDGKPQVCGGHGTCQLVGNTENNNYYYTCFCDNEYAETYDNSCAHLDCFNDDYRFKKVCSGVGWCLSDGSCKCPEGYAGRACENQLCPEGQMDVLAWGCVPEACVNEYDDGIRRVCGGYGHCIKEDGVYVCKCNADGVLHDGICTSRKCLSPDGILCDKRGVCRDGRCLYLG